MDINTPKYSKNELKQKYTLVLDNYEYIKYFSKTILERLQSFLIHIYTDNLTQDEFLEIQENFITIFKNAANQTDEYLEENFVASDIISEQEVEQIDQELLICKTIMQKISGSYENVQENVKMLFEPIEVFEKELREKIKYWEAIKPFLERVIQTILPKHNDSKRKEQLYLYTANQLVIFIDSLRDINFNKKILLTKKNLGSVGMEYLCLLSPAKRFKKIESEALNLKELLLENFETLNKRNPYSCYTEKDYLEALRSFKRIENENIKKDLIVCAKEIAYLILTLLGLQIMPNQIINGSVILTTQLTFYNVEYWNRITDYLTLKENEHLAIERQYMAYKEKKEQIKKHFLEKI